MMEAVKITLPEIRKGRKSKEFKAIYEQQLYDFAETLKQLSLTITASISKGNITKISARGWAYLLEGHKAIDKSQFDECEKIINLCRRNGLLPIDFTAYDDTRKFYHTEALKEDYQIPAEYLAEYLIFVQEIDNSKDDVAFWESQEYYIQMMVEKIDILNLFMDICEKYHISIANAKGWSDMNSRNNLAQRFKEAEEIGLKPVLLYYGDFDPAGILISDTIKNNMKVLEKGTGWNPDNLIVDRFGLNFEFIEANNLTWIDNLITGSKQEANEKIQYVKDYIEKYGRRKCEANAVLLIGDIAIEYCEETILKYLGKDCFEKYNKQLEERKKEVIELMDVVEYKERIQEIMDDIENWKNENHD